MRSGSCCSDGESCLANSDKGLAEKEEKDLIARMRLLQERMAPVLTPLPARALDLYDELRRILQKAIRAEVLIIIQM